MSSVSRITDDEMRYYQFKARQQFLIKKEDHEWNEFCKKNLCSCCSCQSLSLLQKDVAIQTTMQPATNVAARAIVKPVSKFNHNTSVKKVQERPFAKSLNDMKVELERLRLIVSDIQLNRIKNGKEIIENIAGKSTLDNESGLKLLSEQRQSLIRTSLLCSLQRLHSSAAQKMTKPPSLIIPKNKGFFLHPDLEKKRLISRNVYLSSLNNKPKIVGKTYVKHLENKVKKATENSKKQSKTALSKPKKNKVKHTVKLKELDTLIQSQPSTEKDENVENVVDGIIEDLLGEEILDLNRIRFLKLEKRNPDLGKAENTAPPKFGVTTKKSVLLSQPSPETCAKIKEIPFFNLSARGDENTSLPKNSSISHPLDSDTNCPRTIQFNNAKHFETPSTNDEQVQTDFHVSNLPKTFKTLHTDPKLAKRVTRQRKLFLQYLEKVSRSRSYSFDPIALSSMVAESLLDDCISDVCKELEEVPTSLVADLYKQEFTSAL